MNGLTLPYQQTAPKLNADYTAFEVVCTDNGCAIAGIAAGPATPHSAAVYGQAGGAYPTPTFSLQAAVSGQTNLQSYSGVCGASQYGPGVYAISESGNAIQATSTSQASDTILAQSSSMQHSAVSAQNNNSGFGVWANSSGGKPSSPATAAGYFFSDNGNAIQATSTNQGTDAVVAFTSSAGHAALAGHNTATSSPGNVPSGFGIWATSNNTAIYGQGQPAGWFEGNVQVNGTLTVSVDVILSGADFAEDFAVAATDDVEPGTVMVLGEDGMLRPSETSYDRKVAGVVSGAGDCKPGLILDRQNSVDRRLPLAMVGKVWCKVDAQYGAIQVGDLLTTSPTIGHAMRAGDPSQAFGAVIGKALRPLDAGQGLIPILAALQ